MSKNIDPPEKADQSKDDKSLWNDKLAELVLKSLLGGSAGTLFTLIGTSDLPKLALGAGIGGVATMAYAFVEPIVKRTNKGLGQAGESTANALKSTAQAIGNATGQAFAKLTSVESRYFEAQAQECQHCRPEGVAKFEGIFAPMLEKVYVPLALDRTALQPGLMARLFCREAPQSELESDAEEGVSPTLDIWKLLAQTQRDGMFRRIAILAWGGYGKTTLLRHLALTYGRNQQDPALPRLVPMLLLLRKYRPELTQDNPLNLPDLIHQKHIPGLPLLDGKELKLPPTWAETTLKSGAALVMVDGFDEVPTAQRPQVTRWLNAQMRRYSKSTFILTSRPKAYQDQDLAETLDLETIVWVKDFQETQWRQFVQQWYWCQEYYHHGKEDTPDVRQEAERSAEALLDQIEGRSELKDLAKNPLLLNMMATFHRRFPSVELPRRRVELYQEMCLLQLRDRPGAREIAKVLEVEDALVILQMLALEMMQQHEERLSRGVMLQRLTGYLTARSETVAALNFLKYVEQVSELLVQREPEEFEFSHLSFQEYLAAKEVLRLQQPELLYERFADPWWKLTVLMVAAQVNPTELVREMLVRGAQELALLVCRETTRRLDVELLAKVQKARYAQLEQSLKNQQWKAADHETYRLMITIVGKEEGQWFEPAELLNFPNGELLEIDRLWVQYSYGQFGFSVQKKIYTQCSGLLDGKPPGDETWRRFGDAVGWRVNQKWQSYDDLKFSLSSPQGMCPVGVAGLWRAMGGRRDVASLLSHRGL